MRLSIDAVGQVAHAGPLEHDAVLDLRVLDLDVVANRRERPDVGVHDPRAAPMIAGPRIIGPLDRPRPSR